jgi:hypothetical protein
MGFVIFLLIVAGIIVLIVVVIKNKRNKAIEELKTSKVFDVAVKIKEELEKKGQNFGELKIYYIEAAIGRFYSGSINIYFSEYSYGLSNDRSVFLSHKAARSYGKVYYGIENEYKTFLVYTSEDADKASQDVPESIKIAAEVIKNNGCGKCTEVK